jgi:hypothetical protein
MRCKSGIVRTVRKKYLSKEKKKERKEKRKTEK